MPFSQHIDFGNPILKSQKNLPFSRPKIIGHNDNPCGFALNFVLLVCRLLMMIFASFKLVNIALTVFLSLETYIHIDGNMLKLVKTVTILFKFTSAFLLLADAINPSSVLNTFGDYLSRMNFARFASHWGVNVHVFRALLLSIVAYNDRIPVATFTAYNNISNYRNFMEKCIDFAFIPAAALYVFALGMSKTRFISGDIYELSNPWIEEWESRFEYRASKQKSINWVMQIFLIVNISYIFCFIIFFITFKTSENVFQIDVDHIFSIIVPSVVLGLLLFDSLFFFYRRMTVSTLLSSMLTYGVFCGFFLGQVYIDAHEDPESYTAYAEIKGQTELLVYVSAAIFGLNLGCYLLLNWMKVLNFFFWSVKWGFSVGGIMAITYLLGAMLMVVSTIFALNSIMQDYFYFSITISDDFKKFIEVAVVVHGIALKILTVVIKVVRALGSTAMGVFCIIIFIILNVVLPILNAIGFGIPIAVTIVSKILGILMSVFKIIIGVKGYIPIFSSMVKFAGRAKELQDEANDVSAMRMSKTDTLYIALNGIGGLFAFTGVLCCYYYAAERYSEVPRLFMVFLLLLIEILYICFMFFVLCLEFVFSQVYDLQILTLYLFPGWGIFWCKAASIAFSAGLLLTIVSFIFGRSSGILKNRFFFTNNIMPSFRWPSIYSLICPLMALPKNAKSDENICLVCCNRLACCLFSEDVDKLEEGTTTIHYIKQIIFCCCGPDPNDPKDYDRKCPRYICPCCEYRFPTKCAFFKLRREAEKEFDNTNTSVINIKKDHSNYQDLLYQVKDNVLKSKHHLVRSRKNKFAWQKTLGKFFSNGFKKFAQYLIPIFMVIGVYYLVYLAINKRWYTLRMEPESKFASVLNDTSTKSSSDHVSEMENNKKVTCPLLDLIKLIADLILKAILSILGDLFPNFKKFLTALQNMALFISKLDGFDLVPFFLRVILVIPTILFGIFLFILSIISSFIKPFTRLIFVPMISPLVLLQVILLTIPTIMKTILESIPFIDIYVIEEPGLAIVQSLTYILTLVTVMVIVDHFMPPTFPLAENDEYYVELFDEELENVLAVND